MKKIILMFAVCLAVSACAGAKKVSDPVGIGTGTHQLKQSPCACKELPMTLPGGKVLG